jgi:serine protease Do
LKFGSLVILAFALGLLFAGLLDLPTRSSAQQQSSGSAAAITRVQAPDIPAARPLVELSEAFAAVAERVRPSVVYISSERTETRTRAPQGFEEFFRRGPQVMKGTGSGFIVSADGYILTNNHVVEGATTVTVRLLDRREFTAHVIGTDENTDVAVIKIDARNLAPIALGNSDNARIGEWVLAIGNPLGNQLAFTVTSGIVSAKGRNLNLGGNERGIQDFIQTDAAINPGNSGGPLVNVRGEVIGINSAIASETGYYSGYGFAIPINLVQTVMNQLISDGRVHRAALGITVQTASKEDAEYVGLPQIRGVTIQNFQANSPAERAGLEVGDIIVAIDGKQLEYTAQLQQAVGFRKPGETVQVEVARKGGVHKTYSVKLVPMEEAVASADDNTADNTPSSESSGSTGYLGVTVAPLDRDARASMEIPSNISGVVVTSVDPTGPSADALVGADERGGPDVIVAVEGKPVKNERDLQSALAAVGPGKIATLRIYNPLAPEGSQYSIRRLRLGGQ